MSFTHTSIPGIFYMWVYIKYEIYNINSNVYYIINIIMKCFIFLGRTLYNTTDPVPSISQCHKKFKKESRI